jgi:hypothetical protein
MAGGMAGLAGRLGCWDALLIGGKRALVSACVDHILIKPTDPRHPPLVEGLRAEGSH